MEGLFDFIYDHLPDSWFDSFHKAWGDTISDEMVLQSVQEASDFFNMNAPMDVHEDWTTGVVTGIPLLRMMTSWYSTVNKCLIWALRTRKALTWL